MPPEFKGLVSTIESLEHLGLQTKVEIKQVEFISTPNDLLSEIKEKFINSLRKEKDIYCFFSKNLILGKYILKINDQYQVGFEIKE